MSVSGLSNLGSGTSMDPTAIKSQLDAENQNMMDVMNVQNKAEGVKTMAQIVGAFAKSGIDGSKL